MKENILNLVHEIEDTSPGSTDNPKQVGPKEEHTNTHHNYITQD